MAVHHHRLVPTSPVWSHLFSLSPLTQFQSESAACPEFVGFVVVVLVVRR